LGVSKAIAQARVAPDALPQALLSRCPASLRLLLVEMRPVAGDFSAGLYNNKLKDDLKSVEKLYAFNTDTQELTRL